MDINTLLAKYPLRGTMEEFDSQLLQGIDTSRMKFMNTTDAKTSAVIKSRIISKSVDAMLIAGGVGMITGGVTGAVTGGLVTGPGGAIMGTLLGMQAGFVVGLTIGGAASVTVECVQITADPMYAKWKSQTIQAEKYDSYKAHIITQIPDCHDFLCPISMEFPLIPVRSPAGHVYDLEAINAHLDSKFAEERAMHARWIRENTPQRDRLQQQRELDATFCPFRGQRFNKCDLIYDSVFAMTLRSALEEYIEHRDDLPKEVLQGLDAYINSIKRMNNLVIAQKIQLACERMDQVGLRNRDQRTAMIAELLH